MVGSSTNIACPNFIINTIVADELKEFADRLEKAGNFNVELNKIISSSIKEHKRILFSGNNYSKEWQAEAKKRGLLNLKSTVDALPLYTQQKNVDLFERHRVLSKNEIHSRMEILLENYANIINIEALTCIDIARKHIVPAIISYQAFLLNEINLKKQYSKEISSRLEEDVLNRLATLSDGFFEKLEKLTEDIKKYQKTWDNLKKAKYSKNVLLKEMQELRNYADKMELLMGKDYIKFPTYEDILYSVKY